ncbi:hypothetical protein [Nitrosomonas eutropha]|uniref:hypothetical protein n=1 Tax=Nitrosomonas eutropha TaxID=916 RepID=UPI0008BD9B45|nr:hypothetical protein [Nitrosomonas eutropha]SEI50216.1 hypothetical protein SAMN05216318_10473 [Nitrosomonas eutropha]
MTKTFLIFTGHNERAVVALCRALSSRSLPFCLIANSELDPIFETFWAPYVSLVRSNCYVDLSLFEQVRRSVGKSQELIYCPTTEFMNAFVLKNRKQLEFLGIRIILPPANVYDQLTSKSRSTYLIRDICGLTPPQHIAWYDALAPCVFKPNVNVLDGVVLYPILCFSQCKVSETRARLDPDQWFVQEYVEGQSYYLCGYLSRNAEFQFYWQTNLMQQPNGKSIVLARTGTNPGLDESRFFNGLTNMGYFGPIMMEIIEEPNGQLNFIEINPRFWGPLQLAVDACPEMLDLYASDTEFSIKTNSQRLTTNSRTCWYAWSKGAQMHQCHIYPAAYEFSGAQLQKLLNNHDVYRRDDTKGLQGRL